MIGRLIDCLAFMALGLLALIGSMAAADKAMGTEPTPFFIDNNIIPKIVCGAWMGTGVYIGAQLVATARHVVARSGGKCTVNGAPAAAAWLSPTQDLAILKVPTRAPVRAIVSCGGFHEAAHYFATGFAENAAATVTQRWIGSAAKSRDKGFEGLSVFRGPATQGMSGGPIVDDEGVIVGIVIANSSDGITTTLGLAFADTPLCQKEKE